MTKIYTKTGDDGTTGLFDGSRVRKNDLRVEAYGTVDELNAQLGVLIAAMQADITAGSKNAGDTRRRLIERLTRIQHELFTLGAELATPGEKNRQRMPQTTAADCAALEGWIDEATAALTPLRAFVLPGGDPLAAQLHVCRTVCRRAERAIIAADASVPVPREIVIYVNRLSDLLFTWARLANELAGVSDVEWQKPDRASS